MSDTIIIAGYSQWASYLINGDPSGLSDEDFAECQQWLSANGQYDYNCCDVAEESYFGFPECVDFLKGDIIDYTFFLPEKI